MSEQFDLVVIAAGPAGEKAAAQAAYFGRRVAIVEREPTPGGAAVRNAGVPTKTLRETALYVTGFQQRDVYGVGLQLDPGAAIAHLRSRAAHVVETMPPAAADNIARHGIELICGSARLGSGRSVLVDSSDGRTRALDAGVILIATCSAPRLSPFMDGELSDLVAANCRKMGLSVLLGAGKAAVERDADGLKLTLANGEVIRPEKILFAAGRSGNTEALGLAEAGVETDERGRVLVDECFRTTGAGIYAPWGGIGPPGP